ncbi:hypothetical protein [Citrobacter freundii]|uniref:Uncharacterized protein n=1 Tax=Citrobacter freundii TaxID=546 RepID=A0A7G2IV55_CITFR|nr:hypothetical protein [Citrobacter freundii]
MYICTKYHQSREISDFVLLSEIEKLDVTEHVKKLATVSGFHHFLLFT